MGSQSDWATMRHAAETLEALGIAHDRRIVSAHRTPDRLYDFARGAKAAGFKVIIAGAGGAAHLPGMTAALTPLPVFGVPVESKALSGQDSLLFDRADAGRHSGRHAGHRQGRRDQRRAARGRRAGAVATTALADRLDAWRAAQTATVADDRRTRNDCSRLPPARRSASSAAASSAACWRWPPPASATARSSSSRSRTARPRRSPTGRSSPPMTTRPRSPNWRARSRRRHLRVRERAGRRGRPAGRQRSRSIRRRARWKCAQDRLAEKRFLNDIGISTAAFLPVDNDADLAAALKASAAAAC